MQLQRLTALEQDKIVQRVPRGDGRPSRTCSTSWPSRQRITAIIVDELKQIKEQFGDKRRSEIQVNAEDHQPRGPDRAGGRGGDLVARRLHQVAAAHRVPGAEARRARQAGHGDQGRRFHRAPVHRPHPRLHPVLLQPRAGVLDQGVRGAAGRARRAAASRSTTCCRWSTARRSTRCCRSRPSTKRTTCSWPPPTARSRRPRCPSSRGRARAASSPWAWTRATTWWAWR